MTDKLRVRVPATCIFERYWIISVIFSEFFDISYYIEETDIDCVEICADGKVLLLNDAFFSQATTKWLSEETLPIQPLMNLDANKLNWNINLTSPLVPVIFGNAEIIICPEKISLGLDIFGSAFFMLSRYEEVVKKDRDCFDRFPASASLAYQEGFLDRPIINEYMEILWVAIKYLWPWMERKKREPMTFVSADIDLPYSCGNKSLYKLIRQVAKDVLKNSNFSQGFKSIASYFQSKSGNYNFDAYYPYFHWMMNLNEKYGNVISFYFIVNHSSRKMDGCYSLDEPIIRTLMRCIQMRGHEIGLHPSFNTYLSCEQIQFELNNLQIVMNDEGIKQKIIGARQHYLRWKTPTTAACLDYAGVSYDSTLSFADNAGFRCGVCYEYSFYNVVERKKLKLKERPLIVMEQSVFGYMGCSYGDDGLAVIKLLKERCYQFDGDFTLLWHNNQFPSKESMNFYETIIQ